mmetsp:Transcript_38276/g.84038  ORF Transcript_38276/g.84038 Transcript_38276/m.84038 type:complete len:473 (-) Transcript_38276:63-1481(-)
MAGVAGRYGQLVTDLTTSASATCSATSPSTATRASTRKTSNSRSNSGLHSTASNLRAQQGSRKEAARAMGSKSPAAAQKPHPDGHHHTAAALDNGTGCLVCGKDDDHPNILLCEGCNDEYHTYCLRPALNSIPEGDWFCDLCKPFHINEVDDDLNEMVSALPPAFTSRFGEIVWAQGGVGFGWWPACIYDPRLTQGGARQLARKNVGIKHLIYFFECHDAPFAVMGNSKLCPWEEGLLEEHDLGKTARNSGKNRATIFERALQAALIEVSKPTELRMEWNHQNPPVVLSTPQPTRRRGSQSQSKNASSAVTTTLNGKRNSSDGSLRAGKTSAKKKQKAAPGRLNRKNAERSLALLSQQETEQNADLCCKIIKKCDEAEGGIGSLSQLTFNIGFVSLPSRELATYADIRHAMENELDASDHSKQWRFYVPKLGPVSTKQEVSLGPALKFLEGTTSDPRLGDGTAMNPLRIFIT